MSKWTLIDFDGFNISTGKKVITLDLGYEKAKEVIDAQHKSIVEERKRSEKMVGGIESYINKLDCPHLVCPELVKALKEFKDGAG